MSVKQQLVTADELWEMPETPGTRFELVDGEVVEVSPAGAEHTGIMFMLAKTLDSFVSQHDLGVVMPDGLGFVLRRDPDVVRTPDVSSLPLQMLQKRGCRKATGRGRQRSPPKSSRRMALPMTSTPR